jgi:hypothetical protein
LGPEWGDREAEQAGLVELAMVFLVYIQEWKVEEVTFC